MIFPELLGPLTNRVKGMMEGFADTPSLGLKSVIGYPANWYDHNGFHRIAAGHERSSSWSGTNVGLTAALNHSVVWACNRAISEPVGFLPLSLMRNTPAGKVTATEHPAYALLHDSPNDEMTAMGFRETLTSHALLQGNGYAKITRRSGTGEAVALQILQPGQVKVDREKTGEKRLTYTVMQGPGQDKTYTVVHGKPHDIFHLKGIGDNGITGYSVLSAGRQSIGTGLAAERHVGKFYANGGRPTYNIKVNQKWAKDEDADNFRKDWQELYSDPRNIPIIEPWFEYQPTGVSLADSQMLESRMFTVADICRWFNVSPHLAGDLTHATFSNVEQLALDHVKFCLNAWFTRWEAELWRCVLTPEEKKQGYYFKHNVNALLRGDFVSRMAGYASALQNGHKNVDEVRALEDLNPLPDGAGEDYLTQLNMQTLPIVDPAAAHLAATAAAATQERKK